MKFQVTWTARSTRIFENAVRLMCSVLSFGTRSDQYLSQYREGTKIEDGSRKSVSHYTVCKIENIFKINIILLCFNNHLNYYIVMLTHRLQFFDTQQFLVVFKRCGGSEKKNRSLPSVAYTFCTLCSTVLEVCNFTSRLLTDAPSKVAPNTCIVIICVGHS